MRLANENLRQAEDLLNETKFDKALQIVETIAKQQDLTADDHLTCQLLKSQILKVKGEYEKSLELAETALAESKKLNLSLQEVDAHIAMAGALESLDKFNESLEEGAQGEQMLLTLLEEPSLVLTQRKASLLYQKGRNLWKKSDPERALTPLVQSLALYEELNNKYGKTLALCDIGTVYSETGDSDRALDYYQQSLVLNAELNNKLGMAVCLRNIGDIYIYFNNDAAQALEYYQRSLALTEELDNRSELAISLLSLGYGYSSRRLKDKSLDQANEAFQKAIAIYLEIGNKERLAKALQNIGFSYSLGSGELERGLDYIQRGLEIFKEIGHIWGIAYSFHWLGWIHQCKGELELALEYCKQSLSRFEAIDESDSYPFSVWPLLNLGIIYQGMGDFKEASEKFKLCVSQSKESGAIFAAAYALYYLSTLAIDSDRLDEAKNYSQQLNDLYTKGIRSDKMGRVSRWSSLAIHQFSRLSEALILKNSSRLKDKVKAQELFEQLTEENPINFDITYTAMLSLCELFLFELRASREKDVFQDTKRLVQQLVEQARKQSSFSYVVHTLILQAKLAMVEGDLIGATQFLDQAQITANEKDLGQLTKRVSTEINQLKKQFDNWQHLIQSNAPLQARLEQAQLKNYLKHALRLARLGGGTTKSNNE